MLLRRTLRAVGLKVALPRTHMDARSAARLLYFDSVLATTGCVSGDIVEAGVGSGHSLLMLSILACRCERVGRLWAFDSFQGFPDPSPEDGTGPRARKGWFNVATPRLVRDFLRRGKVPGEFVAERLEIVEGFFEDTVGRYDGPGILLLHIDADLYRSYKTVLETLERRVLPGGAILFDEFLGTSGQKWPGAGRAIREYFGDRCGAVRQDRATGKAFLIKDW